MFVSILNLQRFQWTNHNNVLLAKLGARLIRDIDIDLNVFGQKAPDIDFTLQVSTYTIILSRWFDFLLHSAVLPGQLGYQTPLIAKTL